MTEAFMTSSIGNLPINSEGLRIAIDKISELEAELQKYRQVSTKNNSKDKWENIPNYGDHMTIEVFRECVSCGCFIPDDGCGYYATADQMNRQWDVDFSVRKIDDVIMQGLFTHVVWFNK